MKNSPLALEIMTDIYRELGEYRGFEITQYDGGYRADGEIEYFGNPEPITLFADSVDELIDLIAEELA